MLDIIASSDALMLTSITLGGATAYAYFCIGRGLEKLKPKVQAVRETVDMYALRAQNLEGTLSPKYSPGTIGVTVNTA